jgi:hypothetical protein
MSVFILGIHVGVSHYKISSTKNCKEWKAENSQTETNTGRLWITGIMTAGVQLHHLWFGT